MTLREELAARLGEKLPGGIGFDRTLEGRVRMTLSRAALGLGPGAKLMQTDSAAFESWALILRACLGEEVRLAAQPGAVPSPSEYARLSRSPDGLHRPKTGHYHRFLYRLDRFARQYGEWFAPDEADEPLAGALRDFSSLGGEFMNNRADSGAERVRDPEGGIPSVKLEKLCEARFSGNTLVRRGDEWVPGEGWTSLSGPVWSQLKVGLFRTERAGASYDEIVQEKNAFFTGSSSAIDLWKLSGRRLCVYELKAQRKMAGIVTELMFYANFLRDLFLVRDNHWTPAPPARRNSDPASDRGYRCLTEAAPYPEGIDATMLCDELHPLLSNGRVLAEMNRKRGAPEISYGVIRYDLSSGAIL